MAHFLDVLKDRVLLCDGGMGSLVQAANLDPEKDFGGHENCTDILTRTRPDLIRDIHGGYLDAGADMIITNTFGGSPVTLDEFGIGAIAHDLCKEAAELAREVVAARAKDGRNRFVLGDIGPGTKLPSLGHIDYDTAENSFAVQAAGLVAGGVDAILIETCQDPLQIKAAVNGAKQAIGDRDIPIMVQVTVETMGTLLVGSDIAAAATAIRALDVPMLGLNCATGPREMADHVRWLGESWTGPVSVQPNAGLPELVDGKTHYPLQPAELATWLKRFVLENGVNLIGGCCGTEYGHTRALDAMLRELAESGHRPKPTAREPRWTPSVASLYSQADLRQENAIFAIGERCNANGSKKFREMLADENWDGCVAMAREQTGEGSHAIDVCSAYVGRDEVADMTALISRMRGSVSAPLVIDSTELPVIEAALKLYAGKAIINSINFEDGEEPAAKRLALAKKFGAAVVALTIDEEGMAKDAAGKLSIAKRLYEFACVKHGLPPEDLLIDPLTFTICTGNEDDRKLGIETLEGIARIAEALPECQIILGLSNISFGLKPAARHVLNSVYLDHAVKRGMTGAIVHLSKIKPLHSIPENEVAAAEALIYDRREEGGDPLHAFIALFADRTAEAAARKERPEAVEDRLKQRIVDGDRQGLHADLDEAMAGHPPLKIINEFLLDGMKVVGELFGAGKMQLPFVLQSAECMKAAVSYLEPHMDRVEGQEKGIIVLATVKGDVHDIGKNLVDIILTNNGYKVHNLGIKQPIETIIDAAKDHKADAIGMSGLLVKSTVIMRDNLQEMVRQGIDLPVFLGGAALTRRFVEADCVDAYAKGQVAYARDAFDGLSLMDKTVSGALTDHLEERQRLRANAPSSGKEARSKAAQQRAERPVDAEQVKLKRAELATGVVVPEPPFLGAKIIEGTSLKNLVPFLNETMLFQFQWGFKKAGRSREEWKDWAAKEVRPILYDLMERCAKEDILQPRAAYGFWRCASDGDAVVLFDPADDSTEIARFNFPRQKRSGGLCIADFFRDIQSGERDVIGMQVVTMGERASDVAREWFAQDRYQDYLYLHGLGVEMAEAMAEYVHKRVRDDLGIGGEDALEMDKLLKQGYQGSRYSFGYPACPDMGDQRIVLDLLGASRIGLEMADEDQLHPEQSTAAIVAHHPNAKYFVI
ncbi:MAG: methionine synthase [Magnetospiraceae bacterium]